MKRVWLLGPIAGVVAFLLLGGSGPRSVQAVPLVQVTCQPPSLAFAPGGSGQTICSVSGVTGPVQILCTIQPTAVGLACGPQSQTVNAPGSFQVQVTSTADTPSDTYAMFVGNGPPGPTGGATVPVEIGVQCRCINLTVSPQTTQPQNPNLPALPAPQVTITKVNGNTLQIAIVVGWTWGLECDGDLGGCQGSFTFASSSTDWKIDGDGANIVPGTERMTTGNNPPKLNIVCSSGTECPPVSSGNFSTTYTVQVQKVAGKGDAKRTTTGSVTLEIKPDVCATTGHKMVIALSATRDGRDWKADIGHIRNHSDYDGDGFSNQDELRVKPPTDPLDPTKKPQK